MSPTSSAAPAWSPEAYLVTALSSSARIVTISATACAGVDDSSADSSPDDEDSESLPQPATTSSPPTSARSARTRSMNSPVLVRVTCGVRGPLQAGRYHDTKAVLKRYRRPRRAHRRAHLRGRP